jgi:hypothetical protein
MKLHKEKEPLIYRSYAQQVHTYSAMVRIVNVNAIEYDLVLTKLTI